jgi:Zn-dependent protease with chaperone function
MDSNLALVARTAVITGLIGAGLILMIALAGRLARNSRTVLLHLFAPGLYLTAGILTGLILAHALLAIAAIYYLAALAGRIPIGIIAAIGIGAVIGLIGMARSIFSLVQKVRQTVIGKSISEADAPQLWRRVKEIATRIKALPPEHIVLGLDPNFFVTEAEVLSLNDTSSGRTLYCSLPLMRILNAKEFAAVIGHELGHFKGSDTKFSQQFYPIYRGTASSIMSLQAASGEGGSQSIALLPAISIFNYFLECFSVAESRISRDRELCADKEGADITDPPTIASALVKVHAYSPLWDTLREAAVRELQGGRAFINTSKTYAEAVAHNAKPDILHGVAETHLSHPTDSHPPLAVRLEALKVTIEHVSADALDVQPVQPAIDLIENAEKIEKEISDEYQLILTQQFGIDLKSESFSTAEYAPPPPANVFTYMCPNCESFQQSDNLKCTKCNSENPHNPKSKNKASTHADPVV